MYKNDDNRSVFKYETCNKTLITSDCESVFLQTIPQFPLMTPGVPIGSDLRIKTKRGILYLKVIWEVKMAPLRIRQFLIFEC